MKKEINEKIAIVGMSVWYPGAKNLLELWENILSQRIQFREIPKERLPLDEYYDINPNALDKMYANRVAVIDGFSFDWINKKIPNQIYKATDPVQWLALDMTIKMFEDANIDTDTLPKETTGVILGNTMVGDITRPKYFRARWPFVRKALRLTAEKSGMKESDILKLESNMEAVFKSVFETTTEDTMAGELSNTIAGRISNYFNIQGGGHTVDGACSSSLIAIITASDRLLSKDLDFAIAGGVDLSLDTFELIGFSKMGALTKSEMKVYDKDGDGFIAGEGCGIIGLKRLSDAKRDGNKIYATLDGWGLSSDGKSGIATPTIDGQVLALSRAYNKAKLDPSEVDFIEGHGTGTKVGDYIELAAIAKVLDKDDKLNESSFGVTSFKTIVGHTKAASGVGGLIKTAIALNQRVMPPIANCNMPHQLFSTKARILYPITEGERKPEKYQMKAGVSSMGFGGINTHIVLSSADEPYEQFKSHLSEETLFSSSQDCEIFIFSAESQDALKDKISSLIQDVKQASYAEIMDIAKSYAMRINHDEPMRASVIVTTPFQAADKLQELVELLSSKIFLNTIYNDTKKEIFISNEILEKEIAFVFPGQGSQQINSAKKIINRYPWAKDMLTEAKKVFKQNNCEGIYDSIFISLEKVSSIKELKKCNKELQKTEIAQPAIVLSSIIWYEYMIRSGVVPSVVTGHSLGELTAFYSAGCFSFKEVMELSVIRGQAMASADELSGSMTSLMCDYKRAKELISKVKKGYLSIANLNSPTQTVVSGDKEAISELIRISLIENTRAVELAVSNAFHSKIVSNAAQELKEKFPASSKINTMNKTIISSIDGKVVEKNLNLKEHFSKQIIESVDFIATSKELVASSEIIIEVGPSAVLTKLVKLNDSDSIVYPTASEPKSFRDINTVFAMLFVNGHKLNWKNIYSNRLIRDFVSASHLNFITNPCELEFTEESLASIQKLDLGIEYSNKDLVEESIENFSKDIKKLVENKNLKKTSTDRQHIQEPSQSTLELLLNIVSQMTGFPLENIDGSMHLLDDLNLDSIKAGELIASATMQLKITNEIDPIALSGLSLEGISSYLDSLQSKTVSHTEEVQIEEVSQLKMTNKTWVRGFRLKNTLNEIDTQLYTLNKESIGILFPDIVEILYEEMSFQLAKSIKGIFDNYEIDSILSTYDNYTHKYKDVVAILPKPSVNMMFDESSILKALEYISTPLLVPLNSLTYIQFDSPIFHHNQITNIQSGCTNAYAASAHLEHKNTRIRVIDCNSNLHEKVISEILLQEQLLKDKYIFSSYDINGARYTNKSELYEVQLEKRREYTFGKKDVILVTGGAKGITAECALALALKTGSKMALVGSSTFSYATEENSEIAQTLKRFKEHSIIHSYYSCDISNNKEVVKLVSNIENDFGTVTCIIHGAGINNFGRASRLDVKKAAKDCAPKVLGIINLCKALDKNELRLIVGLSSIIGMTGMPGNSVYGFSNEALNIVLQNYNKINSQTDVISIAYSVWDEVGMGAKMGSTKHLEKMGIYAITVNKGVEHFLRLIEHKSQEQFVAVSSKLGGLDTWQQKFFTKPNANRFVKDILQLDNEVELISKVNLSLESDIYLKDHKYRNVYLLPTVFGLEAMGQAVAIVLGKSKLSDGLIIKDIEITQPIIVREKSSTNIYIRAEVLEKSIGGSPWKVKASISTNADNYSNAEFSALFILEAPMAKVEKPFNLLGRKSSIKPETELYGSQLFQGNMFHRIKEVYSMSSDDIFCSIDFSKEEESYSKDYSKQMILGNPYSRDAMLQTAQLTESKMYLPVKISQLNIHTTTQEGIYFTHTQVQKRFEKEIQHKVIVIDQDGNTIEELNGYQSKQVSKTKVFVEAEDFASPKNNDQHIFYTKYAKVQETYSFNYPRVYFDYDEQLSSSKKESRHKIEQNIFNTHSNKDKSDNLENIVLHWNSMGKPCLNNNEYISISHNQAHILLCTGKKGQGCDIEAIETKSRDEWNQLLGKHNIIIDHLLQEGDTLNQAGTRVWNVLESYYKRFAESAENITIESFNIEAIIFKVFTQTNEAYIVTFMMKFTRNIEKSIGLIIEEKTQGMNSISTSNFKEDSSSFHDTFRVSFKDSTLLQKLVDYPMYALWMGKLRESALLEIGHKIVQDSYSGKYAWVTNYSKVKIYGMVSSFNLIEGKVWTSERFGTQNSSNVLHFEWNKVNENGVKERVAYCEMSTTWVSIKDHGIVEAAPYPEYLDSFMSKIETSESSKKASNQLAYNELTQKVNLKLSNKILYRAENSPIIKPKLHTEVVQTSMKHANLIGNVYFSHYYEWQKLCIDKYMYNIVPNFYRGFGESGELFVIHSEVNHLREAMPFYTIKITMHLKALHSNGMELNFNYYGTSGKDGEWMKLANGTCHGVWAKKVYDELLGVEIPTYIIKDIEKDCEEVLIDYECNV